MAASSLESGETGLGKRCCRLTLRRGRLASADLLERPARPLQAGASPALRRALRQVDQYLRGTRRSFDVELEMQAPPFTLKVWKALRQRVPFGSCLSYGDLAALAGNPRASRAVGSAMRRNPLPLFIPCHRVLGARGSLGGFSCGLGWKRFLLRLEGRSLAEKGMRET